MTDTENIISRWESLIGNFLHSFGRIEWFTYYLLTRLPSENIFDSVRSLGLRKRIDLIKQLIIARDIPRETIDSMNIFFQKAKKLSEVRNTVAHNPLHLNIFDLDAEDNRKYQIARYGKLDKPITLEELEKHCKDAKALADKCLGFTDIIDDVVFKQNRITNRSTTDATPRGAR